MPELSPATAFDYALLVPSVAKECRERAQWVKNLSANIADQARHMGQHLAAVRALLPDGFAPWIDLEFAFSRSTAYKLINLWEAFHGRDISRFDKTALYVLAQPSVPEELRAVAFLLAEKGEFITPALAREIVGARRQPPPSKKAVKAYHKLFPDPVDPDDCGADRTDDLADPRHNLVRDHRLLMATLRTLVHTSGMIVIQRVTDTDADDDRVKAAAPAEGKYGQGRDEETSLAVPVLLTVYRDGKTPETFGSAECLEIMILRAGGIRPVQKCRECREEKELLVHFGRKANKGIGRGLRCKRCEAVRVKGAKVEGTRRRERKAERSLFDAAGAESSTADAPTIPA